MRPACARSAARAPTPAGCPAPRGRAGRGVRARTTSSSTPSRSHSAAQWRSSPSACVAQAVVDVQRAHAAAPQQRDARHRAGRPSRARPRSIATSGRSRREQAAGAHTASRTLLAAHRPAVHSARARRDEQLGRRRRSPSARPRRCARTAARRRRVATSHDRARHEHLAAGGARDHARGLVDLAPVVVAVAVERLAVVDPDARRRVAGRRSATAARPPSSVSAAGSVPTTITSSPSVLITRASVGSVCSTASTKRSTVPTASSSPRSTGQARVAGEVGERDRDPQATLLGRARRRARPPCGRSRPARRSGPGGGRAGSS